MKLTTIVISVAAIAFSVSLGAKAAFAQDDGYDSTYSDPCARAQADDGAAGAVFGALAGAALGGGVAGRGHHTTGALIGALAGAAVGSSVGRSAALNSDQCAAPPDDPAAIDQRSRFDDQDVQYVDESDQGDDAELRSDR